VLAASLEVVLIDISAEFVERGMQRIAARFASEVKKGTISREEKDRIMGRIKGKRQPPGCVGFRSPSIEAIVEDRRVKESSSRASIGYVPPTQSSQQHIDPSVTDLGAFSGRSTRFLDLHGFIT